MRTILLALSFLCLQAAAQAHAQEDVAAFYKDKQIRLVVGSEAGSGYDIGARAVARHLSQHIPGHPVIVVQNQPGAASVNMTSSLYNTAPRDGTVIGAAINGMPTAPLLEPGLGARFDPAQLTWLGSTNREVQVTYVWHTAPVQSLKDLYTKELIVGATNPGTSQVDFPLVANAVLGLKFKVVSGYKGTSDIHLAMERGEVQGNGSSAYASLKAINAAWIKEGKVKVIAQWGSRKHPELPDVPAIMDQAKTEADRQVLRLVTARLEYGRPFFAPPDIPPARAEALRRAFDLTMQDPAFLAEAETLQIEINPVTGQEVAALVAQVSATPPDVVARLRGALAAGGGK
jgi:tripartite-type tricarboxylate transporter receptor subunit TctC